MILNIRLFSTFVSKMIGGVLHPHRWVFHFAHLRQLPVLVPYIPTENPRLRDTAYEVCNIK